jgi:hypothetical protein
MKYKLGDRVIMKRNVVGSSANKKGNVGTVTEIDERDKTFRVQIDGASNWANWCAEDEVALIKLIYDPALDVEYGVAVSEGDGEKKNNNIITQDEYDVIKELLDDREGMLRSTMRAVDVLNARVITLQTELNYNKMQLKYMTEERNSWVALYNEKCNGAKGMRFLAPLRAKFRAFFGMG